MSIKLMSAAWELDIPSTEKMVLMCLCDYANDEGENCWPSVATLARKCSKSERTVQGAIRSLEDMGFLRTNSRSGTSNSFILNPRKICTPADTAPPQKTTKTPAKSAPKPPLTTITKNKRAIPANWAPDEFGSETESYRIVSGWSDGEHRCHVEQFIAHHTAAGSKFDSWQAAWSKWVINSEKFKPRQPAQQRGGSLSDIGNEVRQLFHGKP